MSKEKEDFRIEIDVEHELDKIRQRLEGLPKSVASRTLVNALNMAGRKTRADFVKNAKGEYTLKNKKLLNAVNKDEGAPYYSAARGNFASTGKPLEGKIIAHGPVRDVMEYMFKPNEGSAGAAAKVFSGSELDIIKDSRTGTKAFSVTFDSLHVAIVQRIPGKKYTEDGQQNREAKLRKQLKAKGHSRSYIENNVKHADMTRVEKILSPSVPHMLENDKVRAKATERFREYLDAAVEKQIEKTLKKFSKEETE